MVVDGLGLQPGSELLRFVMFDVDDFDGVDALAAEEGTRWILNVLASDSWTDGLLFVRT